jgi:hypothetical protein
VPADSQVELCTTFLRCGNFTTLNSSLTTSHSVNLSGLTTDTYYYYWVLSKNSAGNLTVVGYVTFITTGGVVPTPVPPLPPPPPPGISPTPTPTPTTPTPVPTPIGDVTPPVISNIQITNITRNSATVSWDTDESADSQIYSCIIIFCFSRLIYDSNLTMSHTFNLPNLRAGRNYQIQISASDASGNTSSSNVVSFKTLPGLVISNIRISNAAQTSLTFAWDTNFPADSGAKTCIIIFFCYFTNLTTDPTLTTTHTITISNLRSGTGYYYQVTSYDPTGFTASSQYLYAKTL